MKYRKGYKYQLDEDDSIFLGDYYDKETGEELKAPRIFSADTKYFSLDRGMLTAKSGYAWDGASGPTIDTRNSMRGSLFHDVGYQMMREKIIPLEYKDYFDAVFYHLLINSGMSKLRAWIWYNAVRDFGKSSTLPENDRPILEAP